jgi:hypothetical protein
MEESVMKYEFWKEFRAVMLRFPHLEFGFWATESAWEQTDIESTALRAKPSAGYNVALGSK